MCTNLIKLSGVLLLSTLSSPSSSGVVVGFVDIILFNSSSIFLEVDFSVFYIACRSIE